MGERLSYRVRVAVVQLHVVQRYGIRVETDSLVHADGSRSGFGLVEALGRPRKAFREVAPAATLAQADKRALLNTGIPVEVLFCPTRIK